MVKRILFAGYAPVHFVCFLPVYRQLILDKRVEVWLSGGFLHKTGDKESYILKGFYNSFDVDTSRVIPIEQARLEAFDVMVGACLSGDLFPRLAVKSVEIFHGVSFKNLLVREKALRYDILCLPGYYHASLYRKHGLIRENSSLCTITGFPKVDSLVSGALNREKILQKIDINPEKTTLLYAPTGGKKNSLETMGEKLIKRIATRTEWNLLIKPHDHPKKKVDWFSQLAPFENERIRLIRDNDVVPYMYASDLLISDASSVPVEYTILDRPIIFLDVPKLLTKISKKSIALDVDTYAKKIGVWVESPEEIVVAVQDVLTNSNRESKFRQDAARNIFYKPGNAARRVRDVILYAAAIKKVLPPDVIMLDPDANSE